MIERGPHLLTHLPSTVADLCISRTFFDTIGLDPSFLTIPVESWSETQSYLEALATVSNLPCANECAERGVALIENFNDLAKDELQRQCVLQVVEKHRKSYTKLNADELLDI